MNGGEVFVLLLVAMWVLGGIIRGHYRAKERREHDQVQDADAQRTQEQLTALEERIRVLERIVTDDRYELRQRFRDL